MSKNNNITAILKDYEDLPVGKIPRHIKSEVVLDVLHRVENGTASENPTVGGVNFRSCICRLIRDYEKIEEDPINGYKKFIKNMRAAGETMILCHRKAKEEKKEKI